MACILKLPLGDEKGVITFTTQERDRFILGTAVERAVQRLKPRWLIGLHHNWHDFSFSYDPLFDFSMAGETDLIERDKKPFSLLPLDACNFSPADFDFPKPGAEKFWDVLNVARPVFFKRLPVFLQAIRRLYDRGSRLRVLCICSMPPYKRADRKTVFYDLEERYQEMFSADERRLFNLWVPRYDYPFPLDLTTLAHLYRSSRVFVHAASDERRCRVAAYAWSTGMPVVGMEPVGSLLPAALQKPPYFFRVDSDAQYADAIEAAVAATRSPSDFQPARAIVSETHTRSDLMQRLNALLGAKSDRYFLERLDIRLGRHFEYATSTNTLRLPLELFVEDLASGKIDLSAIAGSNDPERALEARQSYDGARVTRLARVNELRNMGRRAESFVGGFRNLARRYLGSA